MYTCWFCGITQTHSLLATSESHVNSCLEKNKEDILLRELSYVTRAAEFPENFPGLHEVIKIGYDCECASTTECVFVYSTNYPDKESIRQEYSQMQ